MASGNTELERRFTAALVHRLKDRGAKSRLTRATGLSQAYVSQLSQGVRTGTEDTRRAIASALGHGYEDFLEMGRAILEGRDPDAPKDPPDCPAGRGLLFVPWSDRLRLEPGGTIPVTRGEADTPVVVHGPSIGRTDGRRLRAFAAGCRLLGEGATAVADVSENDPENLVEGGIYVVCAEPDGDECVIARLWWAERGRSLMMGFGDGVAPLFRRVRDVRLVGRVVWTCGPTA